MQAHPGPVGRVVRMSLEVGLIAALTVAPVAAAKEANGRASCMGIERAAISPPGSSDEVSGGSSAFNTEVKEIAEPLGVSPGALFSFAARLREGSHAACDEALE
jgi:hypothetical protein